MAVYELDSKLIELVDIDNISIIEHRNMVDIEVEEDNTFTLSSGILSHNSAAKSLFAARGKTNYIGTYSMRGKPLNVREKELAKVLGLDKRKEGKTEPNEIQKILTIIGLKIGEKVETIPMPDEEWVEISINGKKQIVSINDSVIVDGKSSKVSELL